MSVRLGHGFVFAPAKLLKSVLIDDRGGEWLSLLFIRANDPARAMYRGSRGKSKRTCRHFQKKVDCSSNIQRLLQSKQNATGGDILRDGFTRLAIA
jgi:hypothetical protein